MNFGYAVLIITQFTIFLLAILEHISWNH